MQNNGNNTCLSLSLLFHMYVIDQIVGVTAVSTLYCGLCVAIKQPYCILILYSPHTNTKEWHKVRTVLETTICSVLTACQTIGGAEDKTDVFSEAMHVTQLNTSLPNKCDLWQHCTDNLSLVNSVT